MQQLQEERFWKHCGKKNVLVDSITTSEDTRPHQYRCQISHLMQQNLVQKSLNSIFVKDELSTK